LVICRPLKQAMKTIIESYPTSYLADRSMLLLGPYLTSRKKPATPAWFFADLVRALS